MATRRDPDRLDPERLLDEDERLAAEEAAAIGGVAGDEGLEPADRPVREAGGGEAEGFEMAEHDLIRHASHGDDRSDSIVFHDAGQPEAAPPAGEYGEADSVDTTERKED